MRYADFQPKLSPRIESSQHQGWRRIGRELSMTHAISAGDSRRASTNARRSMTMPCTVLPECDFVRRRQETVGQLNQMAGTVRKWISERFKLPAGADSANAGHHR
jgi:hypothetical protein